MATWYSPRRWTREEYYKMAEQGIIAPDERVELIEGEIISMSPQKSRHAATIFVTAKVLSPIFAPHNHVRIQGPLALGPTSEPEPDIAVVAGSERDYMDAHPTTALLVVEVSDTTLAYDRGLKASLYAKAGIPEYWILNLPDQRLEVRREPVPMADQPFGYGYRVVLTLEASQGISPLGTPASHISLGDFLP